MTDFVTSITAREEEKDESNLIQIQLNPINPNKIYSIKILTIRFEASKRFNFHVNFIEPFDRNNLQELCLN